jgi:putative addiction module killer protein
MGYNKEMIELLATDDYRKFIQQLRDQRAKAKISLRLGRLQLGNAGDVKPVGRGISEMRIDYGPGYRIYYKMRERELIILLCGGDKSTQDKDIARAKLIAMEYE